MTDVATLTKMITMLDEESYNSVVNYVVYLSSSNSLKSADERKNDAFTSLMRFKGKVKREINPKEELEKALDEKYANFL